MQVLSKTPKWITLIVPAQLSSGEEAIQALFSSEVMQGLEVQATLRDNFLSAVQEVLWNAIEHGAKMNSERLIRIDMVHSNRALSCYVKDPGPGFQLKALPHAAINNPADDAVKHALIREKQGLRPGGYGILLASNFADELLYNEQGNEVLLVKYLDRID